MVPLSFAHEEFILTGGMDASDPAILAAMQPAQVIDAVLPATGWLLGFPLWRATA